MKKVILALGAFTAVLFTACQQQSEFEYYYYEPEDLAVIKQYLNLPELPPKYSPELASHLTKASLSSRTINSDEATLGRVLFYDKNLSKDKTISCASCHRQDKGFGDDKAVSPGVYERQGDRNSIALSSVANFASYYGQDLNPGSGIPFFWDNRASTAADQAIGSMTNPKEMDMHETDIVEAVQGQPYYTPLFKKAFGDATVTKNRVTAAIASFVNSMGSYQSKFDEGANQATAGTSFVFGQEMNNNFANFTAAENRGKTLYINNCSSCHSTNFGRPVKLYANNGLDATTTDRGVGGVTTNPVFGNGPTEGAFKVPTLRNIAVTGPYMHDGRFKTLEEVLDHYSGNIKNHPSLSAELTTSGIAGGPAKQINLSAQDKSDLISFLNTLTDNSFVVDERFSDPFKR